MRYRYWIGATALALAGQAQAAPTLDELQQQLKALQQAIESLQAQNAGGEPALRSDLQGVQSDLENFKYQVQRDRETATALSNRGLTVSGTIQARASHSSEPVTTAGSVDRRKTSLDVPVAILGFTGSLYRDYEEGRNLTYTLRLGASPLGNGTQFLNLLDANLTYALRPTIDQADGQLNVTFGQQLLPFGLEVPATEDLKPVINNAQFASKLGLAQRQIGVIVRGDLDPTVDYGYNYRAPLLAYALGWVNGAGPNVSDNNSAKDFVGRLAFTAPSDYSSWLRQLTLGASVYHGKQNRLIGSTFVAQGKRERVGVDFSYNHEPFGITFEAIRGEDGTVSGSANAPAYGTVKSKSHTATFFYNFGEQFVKGYRAQARFDDWWPKSYQPFVRVDRFDPNTAAQNDAVDIDTLGLNIFFAQTSKFQLNLNRTHDRARQLKYRDVLAQFQFGF